MDEQKKTLGRSRVYTGNPDGSEPEEAPQEGRRSRRAQPIGTVPKEHLAASSGRRRRDEETDAKMRLLWGALLALIVILIAAIFYEIVLGYGSLETGSERMGTNVQETELSALTGKDDAGQEIQTEEESETEMTSMTSQDSSDSQEEDQNTAASQADGSEQETAAGEDVQTVETGAETTQSVNISLTLAGLPE
ncbi:MAG: hypothetical protein LUD16_03895 [Lachnospiraceae bacterium]|nr:hypothetical protein [Lachnospiraceae bacterium]